MSQNMQEFTFKRHAHYEMQQGIGRMLSAIRPTSEPLTRAEKLISTASLVKENPTLFDGLADDQFITAEFALHTLEVSQ